MADGLNGYNGGNMDLSRALAVAVAAARAAARVLRDDFHRPSGARGHVDKAEADTEAERMIRARLLEAFPGWGYLGEETGRPRGAPDAPVWLVDPNDGTRDYLVGRRGSAVSIGLVVERRPVLGVVFAFGYPDDDGDLFAWAEGCGPADPQRRAGHDQLPHEPRARRRGARVGQRGPRSRGQPALRGSGALSRGAEHRAPAGAGGRGRRLGGDLALRSRGLGLRGRSRAAARRRAACSWTRAGARSLRR